MIKNSELRTKVVGLNHDKNSKLEKRSQGPKFGRQEQKHDTIKSLQVSYLLSLYNHSSFFVFFR